MIARAAIAVLTSLASVLAALTLMPAAATAAPGDHFTCRASALRVEGLPALSVLDAEPSIANALADPCASEHKAIANSPVALQTLLATGTGEASATTVAASYGASASAQVANATVLQTLLGLHVGAAAAAARYICVAGSPVPQSASNVLNLRIGNGNVITTSGRVSIPVGGLADVELNRTISTATSVTRRAVDITILGGVYGGVHIVLGEAKAGISGNPCVGLPVNTGPPVITGGNTSGQTLSCSPGKWTNHPTSFTYQWSVNGTPIAGATGPTYQVPTEDQGLTLTCTVTATNAAGAGAPATSPGVKIKVPFRLHCPGATGSIHGKSLGPAQLGLTRVQMRRMFPHSSSRGRRSWQFFCLTPKGIRVGYAGPKLLSQLPAGLRRSFRGRGIIASTAYGFYEMDGIRHGSTLAAARKALGKGHMYHVGQNWWFMAPHGAVTAILKLRHGLVQEVGVANARLTRTPKDQFRFITSIP